MAAEKWLLRNPVANTIPLTTLARGRRGLWQDGILLGWLVAAEAPDGEEVRGVVLHTPPHPVLLADIPVESVRPLVETFRSREVSGVFGPIEQADAFVAALGRAPDRRMEQRLYRLGVLVPPSCPGQARPARPDELDVLVTWYAGFLTEVGVFGRGSGQRELLRARVEQNELVVWENAGEIVSFAGFSTPLAGMSRIGPVYTPPRHRRHGYGSAVTHAATVAAHRAGATEVVLFTDLGNPTTNTIYQALGYRPVADYARIFYD